MAKVQKHLSKVKMRDEQANLSRRKGIPHRFNPSNHRTKKLPAQIFEIAESNNFISAEFVPQIKWKWFEKERYF